MSQQSVAAESVQTNGRGGLRRLAEPWRSLRSPNYRLFFIGQLISLVGNWMTQVATSWLVYRLTHSTLQLGLVTFAGQIPAFLLAPIAGVLVDRWDLRRTLLVTQTLAMFQSLALAYFTLSGTVTVHHLLVLYVFQGAVNGFDIPARQAIIVQLIERREDLGNAIALNSSLFNLARLIGPSVAGFVIAAVGEGYCFLIDGISYVAAIVMVFSLVLQNGKRLQRRPDVLGELGEGMRYSLGSPPIRALLAFTAVLSLVGLPYTVLMPVFARDVLHGDARTMGFLMTGIGSGALIGAIMLAMRKCVVGLGRWIVCAGLGMGAAIILFSLSRVVWMSVLLMGIAGLSMVIFAAATNTLLQTIVDDDKRGRVMSLFIMAFMGMLPLGSLLAGELARPDRLGPKITVILGGMGSILASLVLASRLPSLREHVRPIYVRRGILPPIAEGLQAATALNQPPEQAG